MTQGLIIREILVQFQTILKSDSSFTWLYKIINSSLNKALNYESGMAHQGELVYFARPCQFTIKEPQCNNK